MGFWDSYTIRASLLVCCKSVSVVVVKRPGKGQREGKRQWLCIGFRSRRRRGKRGGGTLLRGFFLLHKEGRAVSWSVICHLSRQAHCWKKSDVFIYLFFLVCHIMVLFSFLSLSFTSVRRFLSIFLGYHMYLDTFWGKINRLLVYVHFSLPCRHVVQFH